MATRRLAASIVALTLIALPCLPRHARADAARVEGLGAGDLLLEDSSNVFTNPSLLPFYGNRAWFSLGVTGGAGAIGIDPHGGASVRIKNVVTLGIALNRSPRLYGFDRALWPVLNAYVPGGPGQILAGPDGPAEQSAALRFPVDLLLGIGDPYSPFRFGVNLYYAGGATRSYELSDYDGDGEEDVNVRRAQSHLFNVTLGVSGGTPADRTRAEGWVRLGWASVWADEQAWRQSGSGADREDLVDRIVAMDRDLRVGGGFRVHLGDPGRGLVVTPALSYDFATGAFRFDDNMINPDSPAEGASRVANAHDATAGVGVTYRADDLLVHGGVSLRVRVLEVTDIRELSADELEWTQLGDVVLNLPEVNLGAEYRLLPWLLVRAGLKSTVAGGRSIATTKEAAGPDEDLLASNQYIDTLPAGVSVRATGGVGLEVKRFSADLILGGLFLPDPSGLGSLVPNLVSRLDLSFRFD